MRTLWAEPTGLVSVSSGIPWLRDFLVQDLIGRLIFGGGLVFLPTFLAFWKAKTAYFSHFEAKKEKGTNKKGDQNWSCFFLAKKCTFPAVLSIFLSKT